MLKTNANGTDSGPFWELWKVTESLIWHQIYLNKWDIYQRKTLVCFFLLLCFFFPGLWQSCHWWFSMIKHLLIKTSNTSETDGGGAEAPSSSSADGSDFGINITSLDFIFRRKSTCRTWGWISLIWSVPAKNCRHPLLGWIEEKMSQAMLYKMSSLWFIMNTFLHMTSVKD